jgi:hypothetical protein
MAKPPSRPVGAVATPARADHAAYERSVRVPVDELVDQLRTLLGARLVAYLGGVTETRAVRQWAEGERTPAEAAARRLRLALRVALILTERDTPAVAQAWFLGANPHLTEVAPARRIREGNLDEIGPAVLAAAKAFAS